MSFKHDDPCREKADDDEPIFTLRAQDTTAPGIVRMWADYASAMGTPDQKIEEALAIAKNMRAWQLANPERVKVPD